jgi:RHS repeat-associated protein
MSSRCLEAPLELSHVDHLNTPRLITNDQGQAVWRWDQAEPFGVTVADENPSGLGAYEMPLRFPGQYFDKETKLHYNYFRDYDSAIGRYAQSDPIGLRGGLNTYAYVSGNPLSRTDPRGLSPACKAGDSCRSTKICWRQHGTYLRTCEDGLPEWEVCLVFSTCYPYLNRTERSVCPQMITPPRG